MKMGFPAKYGCVFLQQSCVAPPPSRDFYAVKVTGSQLSLCIWKLSHGRHHYPVEQRESLDDFMLDRSMQDEIKRIFGPKTVKKILEIARGKKDYLPCLPMNILLKILCRLELRDIAHFAQVCRKCREVCLSNELWKQLFHKYNRSEITYEERKKAVTCGWKKLFMQKKLNLQLKTDKKHRIDAREPILKQKILPLLRSDSMFETLVRTTNSSLSVESTKKVFKTQKTNTKGNKSNSTSEHNKKSKEKKLIQPKKAQKIESKSISVLPVLKSELNMRLSLNKGNKAVLTTKQPLTNNTAVATGIKSKSTDTKTDNKNKVTGQEISKSHSNVKTAKKSVKTKSLLSI